MSTNDVPGGNPINNDVLKMGCWAESSDGSLMFVESVENGRVIYSMFDASRQPVIEYRDAMPETEFKTVFSWNADRSAIKNTKSKNVPTIKWTWHDKSSFPWDKVAKDGIKYASAADQISDAQRVADSLNLRAEQFKDTHLAPKTRSKIGNMMRKFAEKFDNLISE